MEKRAFLLREMIDQQEVTSALLVLWRNHHRQSDTIGVQIQKYKK